MQDGTIKEFQKKIIKILWETLNAMNRMLDAFFRVAKDLIVKDERVLLLFGAAGVAAPKSMADIMKRFPERVFDAGIMEQAIVSMTAGMAIEGMIPIFYAQSPFITERAYEQLKVDFGYQQVRGNFVGLGASAEIANFGTTHCSPGDISVLKQIPGMQVVVPGRITEFESLFYEAYANDSPTYYRITRYNHSYPCDVSFGKANIMKKGKKATIIAVGPILELVMRAVKEEDVTILYYTTVAPFDNECLKEHLSNNRVLLCEPNYYGTLTRDVISALQGEMIKMDFIGYPLEFITNYGYVTENAEMYGFTEQNIISKLHKLME
ncbi:hypothetical protein D3Z58_22830 [Clostridiaceae bacterium]|nr:hypothetical protein [Clostridiaceae bacterium]